MFFFDFAVSFRVAQYRREKGKDWAGNDKQLGENRKLKSLIIVSLNAPHPVSN
jgi:hypothetical protein